MIKNYLLVAWRVFKRNKLYNIINIIGFSLSIAVCLVIALYIQHENNYDIHLKNAKNIFSIYSRVKLGTDTVEFPLMNYTTAPIVASGDPSVISYVRIHHPYKEVSIQTSESGSAKFSDDNFLFADSNFFNFFSFHLKYGSAAYVLQKPFTVVITRSAAKKYFGNVNPVGRLITVDSAFTFEVTGVADDPPSNSIFKFDLVASLSSKLSMKGSDLILAQHGIGFGDFQTFFLLKNPVNPNHFQTNIRSLALRDKQNENISLQYVIPLLKMHLHAKFGDVSNIKYLNIFLAIGILILFIALNNYVSLTSAKAILRSKEIGIRKVLGADKVKIIKQFYFETSLYVIVAFGIGIVLFFLIKPLFYDLSGFRIDNFFIYTPEVLTAFGSILVVLILLGGSYPSFLLSTFLPTIVLYKGKHRKISKGLLKKILITAQFTLTIAVIVCSIIINRQVYFIRHSNTGVQRSNIIMIPFTTSLHNNYYPLKEDIRHLTGVANVATARYPLYGKFQVLTAIEKKTNNETSLPCFTADEQFISLLNLHWKIFPRNLSISKEKSVIINEAAINKLALPFNPLNQKVEINGEEYHIDGVLKDFNYTSLTSKIDALCIFIKPDSINAWGDKRDGCLFIKFDSIANVHALITLIQNIYNKYDKTTPFNYNFLNTAYDEMYKAESRLAQLINIFTLITTIIALLGLFGLASFSAEQKIKEFGVRKILGASVKSIVRLLILDFIRPVFSAASIAVPLAWYFMDTWLQNFAYHIAISIWVFVFSIAITIILAISTTLFISIKAASVNPIQNLRIE